MCFNSDGSVNTCQYDCLYLFDCGCGYDHDCDESDSDDLYSTESDDCLDDNSSVEPSGEFVCCFVNKVCHM